MLVRAGDPYFILTEMLSLKRSTEDPEGHDYLLADGNGTTTGLSALDIGKRYYTKLVDNHFQTGYNIGRPDEGSNNLIRTEISPATDESKRIAEGAGLLIISPAATLWDPSTKTGRTQSEVRGPPS